MFQPKAKVDNKYPTKDFKAPVDTPEHIANLVLIVKNNAEIRRFTALGILNYLLQKGQIKGNNRFVYFKWDKFVVKFGTMSRDYEYSEPFFINALVASFSSFSSSAQRTIDNFTRKEMNEYIEDVASVEVIDEMYAMNEPKN